jgi:hypothetical protein
LLRSYNQRTVQGLRDRTLCIVGLTRGFRSATIVGIQIEDITFEPRGVVTGLRHEKTARNAQIISTGTPHTQTHEFCMPCSVKQLVDALAALGIIEGPLFRSIDRWQRIRAVGLAPKSVTVILRCGLQRAGVEDPDTYSSHSFRHGLVFAGRHKGWTDEEIMLVTMHRTLQGLEPYKQGLGPWHRSPERCILDGGWPAPAAPGQGWKHA